MKFFLLLIFTFFFLAVFANKKQHKTLRLESFHSNYGNSQKSFLIQSFYAKTDYACATPISQVVTELGICISSASYPGSYFIQTLEPDALTYDVTTTFYSDSQCLQVANSISSQKDSIATNQCQSNRVTYQQVVNRSGGSSGPVGGYTSQQNVATLALFQNSADCQGGNYGPSVASVSAQLYICVPTPNGDAVYTSCTPSLLTGSKYSSTDGSCTGHSETFSYTSNDWCSVGGSLNGCEGVLNIFCTEPNSGNN